MTSKGYMQACTHDMFKPYGYMRQVLGLKKVCLHMKVVVTLLFSQTCFHEPALYDKWKEERIRQLTTKSVLGLLARSFLMTSTILSMQKSCKKSCCSQSQEA